MGEANRMREDLMVGLVKGGERYVFIFRQDQKDDCLKELGEFAKNPELSFSWYDAAVLSQKVRSG